MRRLILITFIAVVCAACQPTESFVSVHTSIESRGVQIPATFVHPESNEGVSVPLVVMAHGHGGTRDEAGGFARVAEALADAGIASIRVDFPGCGESTEPFTSNDLTNMLADVQASREYALLHPGIDPERVGILGYSMGGRLALLATRQSDYPVMALWAPAAGNGIDSMFPFLGGKESYERLRMEAVSVGFATIDTLWGARQELSLKWFTDNEESKAQAAARDYAGALLVLYGKNDNVVRTQFAKAVVADAKLSKPLVEHAISQAGHGLGFYSGYEEVASETVKRTVLFFRENLVD